MGREARGQADAPRTGRGRLGAWGMPPSGGYFAACLATISFSIFLYSDSDTIFLAFKSLLALYGRPSMIFWAYASPMPGNAASCSLVAVLTSTICFAAAAGLAAVAEALLTDFDCGVCVAAYDGTANAAMSTGTATSEIQDRRFMASSQGVPVRDEAPRSARSANGPPATSGIGQTRPQASRYVPHRRGAVLRCFGRNRAIARQAGPGRWCKTPQPGRLATGLTTAGMRSIINEP